MLEAVAASRIGLLLADPEAESTPDRPSMTRCAAIFLFGIVALSIHARAVSGSLSSPRTRLDGGVATTKRHDGHEDPRMEFTQKLGAAAGAVALSLGCVARAQDAVQWRVEDGGNGHWYALISGTKPIRWEAAHAAALELGGFLACPSSPNENTWVHATLASRIEAWNDAGWVYGPWIGGYRSSPSGDEWAWVSGEIWAFTAWHSSQPDSTSQTVLSFGGGGPALATWADTGPEEPVTSFIVEWSADCNDDGVVDYGQIRSGELPDLNANGVPDNCEPNSGSPYAAIQWNPSSGGNGHWYQVLVASRGIGWSEARVVATQFGAALACAESSAEKKYAFASFSPAFVPDAWIQQAPWTNSMFGPWLGGMQATGSAEPVGGWSWISGLPFDPTELGCCNNDGCTGAEDRLHLISHDGAVTWNDLPDTWTCGVMPNSLLIEWSADCNRDGAVDFGQILAGELDDADRNNIPDCCEGRPSCNCAADIARDGVVNGIDLAAVLNNWGSPGGTFNADINNDGLVDGADLAEVLNSWGPCP